MMRITKESLAPIHFQPLRREHRANSSGLVPQITFCLYLCNAVRKSIEIEEIAAQASTTYPADFYTWVNGEPVPDLAVILLILEEATSPAWGYAVGDWSRGWHLTKKGLRFAKDVARRRLSRGNA